MRFTELLCVLAIVFCGVAAALPEITSEVEELKLEDEARPMTRFLYGTYFPLNIPRPRPVTSTTTCPSVAICCKVKCTGATDVCLATGVGLMVCATAAAPTVPTAGTDCRDAASTTCPACATFTCTSATACAGTTSCNRGT